MNLDSERCALVWMYGPRLEPDAWLNMYIPAMHHDAAGARSWIRRRKKKTCSSATCGGNKVKVTPGRASYSGEGREEGGVYRGGGECFTLDLIE